MKKKLRAHHLLCIPLFQGEGYSDGFCENMTEQIEWLKNYNEEEIVLISDPDMICEHCSHLLKKRYCRDKGNQVKNKDQRLLEALHLKEGNYSFSELILYMKEHMTEEIFFNSCQNCQWRQCGLCSYQKYQKGLRTFGESV